MKPDLGVYLYERGFRNVSQYFYGVAIFTLDRTDIDIFTTTVNSDRDGVEFCLSFDFSLSQTIKLVEQMPSETDRRSILGQIERNIPFQFNLSLPFKLSSIQCLIGEQYQNQNEKYRPFIVKEISY